MSRFKERLLEAESQLFDTLSNPQDIRAFKHVWSALAQDIQCAISCRSVDTATIAQYNATSNLVQELSRSMMEYHEEVEVIDAAFQQELDSIFARWEKSGTTLNSQIEAQSTRRDVSLAAEWLSINYYNPYPPTTIRDDISRRANWNRKDVDAWFTEARKRIGWNDIRRKYFGNRRAETVEKATRFFTGSYISLEPILEQALMELKSRVKEFYVDPFTPSELVASLDKARSRKTSRTVYKEEISRLGPLHHTPLRPTSLEPRPLSPVSRTVTPISVNRKRQRDNSLSEDDTDVENRPKRLRPEDSVESVFQTQLPSPVASQSDLTEVSSQATLFETPNSSRKRKRSSSPTSPSNKKTRRNSTPQIQGCSKNPSDESRGTSLQAVSAPLLPHSRSQPGSSDLISVPPQLPDSNLSPNIPLTLTTLLNSCPTTPSPLVNDGPTHLMHPLSQAEFPTFTYELPGPATCDQPAMQAVDMSLFQTTNLYDLHMYTPGPNASGFATLLEDVHLPVRSHPVEGPDLTSIPGFPGNPPDDQDLLSLFPPLPFDHTSVSESSPLTSVLSGADSSFSPLFGLDATASQQPLHVDDIFFGDFLLPTPASTFADTEKAKRDLEAWKKHEAHVQEHIQYLERQIATKACA